MEGVTTFKLRGRILFFCVVSSQPLLIHPYVTWTWARVSDTSKCQVHLILVPWIPGHGKLFIFIHTQICNTSWVNDV